MEERITARRLSIWSLVQQYNIYSRDEVLMVRGTSKMTVVQRPDIHSRNEALMVCGKSKMTLVAYIYLGQKHICTRVWRTWRSVRLAHGGPIQGPWTPYANMGL